jgi:hypothetical protein
MFGINGCLYLGPIADLLAIIFTVVLLKIYWGKIFNKGDNSNGWEKEKLKDNV